MDDDELFVLAVLGVLLMVSRRIEWGSGWVFPVPDLVITNDLYPATISQEWRYPDHLGVDIMFRRRNGKPANVDHGAGEDWFAPEGTPIYAAKDGKVWSAGRSPRGWDVVLDHGPPFATFYQHLALLMVPLTVDGKRMDNGQEYTVKAGDLIGYMGYDVTDPEEVRHLHFAVWYNGAGDNASVDPAGAMQSWPHKQTGEPVRRT